MTLVNFLRRMFLKVKAWRASTLAIVILASVSFCKEQDKSANTPAKRFLYTTESGVSFREEPKPNAKLIRTLKAGERVEYVTEETDAKLIGGLKGIWTCVNFEGKEGWVFGYFLSKEKEEQLVPLQYATPEEDFFGKLEESINSRKARLVFNSEEKFKLNVNTACLEGGGSDRQCISEGPIQIEFNKSKKSLLPSFGLHAQAGERQIKGVTRQDVSQFELNLSEPLLIPGNSDETQAKNSIFVTVNKKSIEVVFSDGKSTKFRWLKE